VIGSVPDSFVGNPGSNEAEHTPGSVFFRIFAGQVMTGGSFGITTTVNEQDAAFPHGSVAVYVIVVVPTLKWNGTGIVPEPVPAVGDVITQEILIPPVGVQLSLYVGNGREIVAKVFPGSAITLTFAGQPIAGGVLSCTEMTWVTLALLEH